MASASGPALPGQPQREQRGEAQVAVCERELVGHGAMLDVDEVERRGALGGAAQRDVPVSAFHGDRSSGSPLGEVEADGLGGSGELVAQRPQPARQAGADGANGAIELDRGGIGVQAVVQVR